MENKKIDVSKRKFMQLGTLVGVSSFIEYMAYVAMLFTDETTLGKLLDTPAF